MTTEQLVKPLQYCSTAGACDGRLAEVYQRIFGHFCDSVLKEEARDGNTIKLPREQEKNEWND